MQNGTATPDTGPIIVVCANADHQARRFATMALAESYLVGNAIDGECSSPHRILDTTEDRTAEREFSMERLGELLGSLMPAEDDEDDCENGLDWRDNPTYNDEPLADDDLWPHYYRPTRRVSRTGREIAG